MGLLEKESSNKTKPQSQPIIQSWGRSPKGCSHTEAALNKNSTQIIQARPWCFCNCLCSPAQKIKEAEEEEEEDKQKKQNKKNPGLDDDQEERAEKQKNKVFLLDTKGQDVIMCRCHGLHVHTIKNTDTHTRHNQAARKCLQPPYLFYDIK